MQFEEHISAFIDGALDAAEETEFLHILSVSPEKRALLHEYLSLKSMLAADARAITVPPSLDAAVLGAAGVGTAAGLAAAGGAVGGAGAASVLGVDASGKAISAAGTSSAGTTAAAVGHTSGLGAAVPWWTLPRILGTVLLGCALFTGGFLLNDTMKHHSDPAVNGAPATSSTGQHDLVQTTSRSGSQTSPQPGDPRAGQATPPAPEYRTIILTRVDTVFLPPPLAKVDTVLLYRIDTQYVALAQLPIDKRAVMIQEAPVTPPQFASSGRIDVEVQREHLSTWPYIDYHRAGVEREQQHFSIFAAYALDQMHAAGLMVGEKSFAMEYYRIENDSLYIYQRQPALLYGGGFYRFSLPLSGNIAPEAMFQLGGTDLGPVIGARLALRFSPLRNLSILLGADGAVLAYRYKDRLFTSHSLGLTYGIRYQF
ncbi:MAG: hypothetical protein M5R41_14610 [Bacteroidia bacterium]|nr:hypothetical protein [Bacteroidia bacterium]